VPGNRHSYRDPAPHGLRLSVKGCGNSYSILSFQTSSLDDHPLSLPQVDLGRFNAAQPGMVALFSKVEEHSLYLHGKALLKQGLDQIRAQGGQALHQQPGLLKGLPGWHEI
jgi:hypothetical protein